MRLHAGLLRTRWRSARACCGLLAWRTSRRVRGTQRLLWRRARRAGSGGSCRRRSRSRDRVRGSCRFRDSRRGRRSCRWRGHSSGSRLRGRWCCGWRLRRSGFHRRGRRSRRGCGSRNWSWSRGFCCCRWMSCRRSERHRRRRWPPRRGLRRRFFRSAFGFHGGLGVRDTLQMVLNFFRDISGNRAGVGLLFLDSKTRQKVNDGFRLDLEFARELIDADLICVAHAS